jgi:2-dehydro-3-deoxygalactonokinase
MSDTYHKWVMTEGITLRTLVCNHRRTASGLLKQTQPGTGVAEQLVCAKVFDLGLARDLEAPDILPRLFEVRAADALGQLPREHVSEFLSGLLMGSEVRAWPLASPYLRSLRLSLTLRYPRAFALKGQSTQVLSGDIAFQAGKRSFTHAMAN